MIQKMKKKIFIILVIIAIIIAVVLGLKKANTNKYNYEIEEITNYNYYISKENEKYGVIDKEGSQIIETKYDNIIIPNPEKDIFICYIYNGNPEILNSKGEKLFSQYEEVQPIKLKSEASTLTYEKSVLTYKKDGLYGLISFDGKTITQNIYSTIENLQPTEGKFLVSKDEKYGVIDLKGNTLVETEYDKIESDGYYTLKEKYKKSGYIVSVRTDDGYRSGYINYRGKKILETKYNEIERLSKEDEKNIYLIASEEGKVGLYKNSKNVIKHEYQSITYNDQNNVILQKNKKYGAALLDGKIVIDVDNESVESKGIYLYTKSQDGNKVYDENGNVININYNKTIYETESEDYRISTVLNNNVTYYGIIDKSGNKLVDESYRYIEYLYKNYFIATDENGNLGVINSNGKIILEMKYSSLQKIKGKQMVQAVENGTNTSEFYSSDMKEILKMSKPNIQMEDDYIVVSNDEEKQYLDNNGNIIQDISNLKQPNYPNEIGDYKKEQITVENVYYIKK